MSQLRLFNGTQQTPVILNNGLGVDSTAMLVGLAARRERPDLVIFADTDGEKPETIAYLDVINPWLRTIGFPEVMVVRRPVGSSGYRTL